MPVCRFTPRLPVPAAGRAGRLRPRRGRQANLLRPPSPSAGVLAGGIVDGHLAPANLHDLALAEDLLADAGGWALGDRSYWSRTRAGCWPTRACGCWRRRPARPRDQGRAWPAADSSTAAGRDRDRSARSSATTPRGSGPAMPGSCGHAGSASRSATPWPSTCASRPAWAHSASPTSSPPETRTPGQLGSTGGSGHDHHGLAWRLGRLRPVAMEVALEREVAHLALDHPRPGPQPAWGSRWRSASATACRVALASRRGETRPGR
jgi:hypothetical protein